MAGDWIKVEKKLNDKPEVRRMARALHLSRFDIVGRLVSVWSWADSHSFTGSGMDISEEDIDDIADLNGFADALRQVGWLKGRAASLEFPNFGRHNGQSAKRRAMESERKRLERMGCDDNADKRPHRKRTKCGQNADQRREEKIDATTTTTTGREVRQFPQDVSEVDRFMAAQALHPIGDELTRCAERFFDEQSAVGWRNKHGIPLADWRPLARQYAATWARNNVADAGLKPSHAAGFPPKSTFKPSRRDDLWKD